MGGWRSEFDFGKKVFGWLGMRLCDKRLTLTHRGENQTHSYAACELVMAALLVSYSYRTGSGTVQCQKRSGEARSLPATE